MTTKPSLSFSHTYHQFDPKLSAFAVLHIAFLVIFHSARSRLREQKMGGEALHLDPLKNISGSGSVTLRNVLASCIDFSLSKSISSARGAFVRANGKKTQFR